ncbi:toll-like receptor 13 [Notechis scutatus]|uniref:Toll-like receptor 13 n=1 Tax=Notechis scutatus TaxID=8663 RepID=A0A6J1UQG6_9SAUR|nr:toll-like receptor 13 [Notechis scutatus]XP_026533207.1 toll-like receptor 13 [Notechis scutatus]
MKPTVNLKPAHMPNAFIIMPALNQIPLKLCTLLVLFTCIQWNVDCFGFKNCVLSPNRPGLAVCTGHAIINLNSAIASLPNVTYWLNASHNLVEMLNSTTFSHLPALLKLYLDHNNISHIEPNTFQSLEGLEVLDLSWNQLTVIGPALLANLKCLCVLHLNNNKIAAVHPSSFMFQFALRELILSTNKLSSFQEIAIGVKNLSQLTILDLGNNSISAPCVGPSLLTFPFLRNLSLNRNVIHSLDLSNCSFPSLQQLDLSINNMSELKAGPFQATPALTELSLDSNSLKISELINISLPNLTMLHLSSMHPSLSTNVSVACSVFQSLPSLISLDIKRSKFRNNQLRQLGSCTNLTWLTLSTSQFRYLENKTLETFQNLKYLSMDKCKILKLGSDAWGKGLPLQTLILSRNDINKLDEYAFAVLKNLSYLDLSKNRLTNLQTQSFFGMAALRTLILHSCQITAVTRDTFTHAHKIEFLDLSFNSITRIKDYAFSRLLHVKTLLLSGNRILTVQSSAFRNLGSLKYLALDQNFIYKFSKSVFKPLKQLITLDLSYNHLFTYNKYDTPSPFQDLHSLVKLDISFQTPKLPIHASDNFFQGLENLKFLSLKGNPSSVLSHLSFINLTNLKSLDLSEIQPGKRGYWELHSHFFQGLTNLHNLWLEDSAIPDLPEEIFSGLTSLEELDLSNNDLKNFSQETFGRLSSLKYLDVSENPLICSCENAWFQNWSISVPNVQVALLDSYYCFGPGLTNRPFADEDLSFCFENWEMYLFIATTVTVLLFLLPSLIYAKFGWTFRYALYLLRGWGYKQLCPKGRDYQYDAYISCCSHDYKWVIDNILEKLEKQYEPCFRLCFGPRDFAPGQYYIDNVQNGISRSRKTLCLVSRNYLEDEWCSLEIQLACSNIYYHGYDPLVVVFKEEIPNYRLSPYHRLRKLIKQESYLTWPEDPEDEHIFWTKLCGALCFERQENVALFTVTE